MKVSNTTMSIGRASGYYTPVDCFRFRVSILPEKYFNEEAGDQAAEIERYNRNATRCAKIAAAHNVRIM